MDMNQQGEARIHQVLVKLLDGTHRFLNFTSPIVTIETLKRRIETLTSVPNHHHLLLLKNRYLKESDHQTVNFAKDGGFPAVVHLSARLRGGKGGFGSLLRSSATKAGQKKANNFDACRDMNGRRIRHVNAEKKLEEWKAGAEERQLEKKAEEYIKKRAKEAAKKGLGKGAELEKYVQKYKADSNRCREAVEKSVKESMKRKMAGAGVTESKKLKIWCGKRKMGLSDSEDDSEEDEDEENNKSAVLNKGDHSDSSEEANGSSDSVKEASHVASSSGCGVVSESASDEEKAAAEEVQEADEIRVAEPELGVSDAYNMQRPVMETGVVQEDKEPSNEPELVSAVKQIIETSVLSSVDETAPGTSDSNGATDAEAAEPMDIEKPLNFDDIKSAADLGVLGMDRLKSELQARGLKCGGTMPERAARLFLLKTTPIEKLPKKYFAKK